MTELAYIVREDWAQHGTAMATSSAHIRDWLGVGPYLFAVTDVRNFNHIDHSADLEAAEYIAPGEAQRRVVNLMDLTRLTEDDRAADIAVVVLHPFERRDCEVLRSVLDSGMLGRMFILIWSARDVVRIWLDGHGAVNLGLR